MRWCVVHDAQEVPGTGACWIQGYEMGGTVAHVEAVLYPEAKGCSLVDVALEPMASMERTLGDDVPEGEGWHVIVDSADPPEGEELPFSEVRWRLWSKTIAYRAVLPGWFDKDFGRVEVTEEW